MKKDYKRILNGCKVGLVTQAVLSNIMAIIFVPLMTIYNLKYSDLGLIILINFVTQVTADLLFSGAIDKIGYKKLALPCSLISILGLVILGLSPYLFKQNILVGIVIATVISAFSSGLLEVIVSPMITSAYVGESGSDMSFFHSFYSWGVAIMVALTTLGLFIFGIHSWNIIVLCWTIVPLSSFILFCTKKYPKTLRSENHKPVKDIIKNPFFIFALLAIFFGGGAEIIMTQWSSSFLEKGLMMPKLTGDLIGMCGFAVMMGIARMFFGKFGKKFNMVKMLAICSLSTSILYIICALSTVNAVNIIACVASGFSVAILWPFVLVITEQKFKGAGAWMFAILALFGDLGAAVMPYFTGLIVDSSISSGLAEKFALGLGVTTEQGGLRLAILCSAVVPFLLFLCHLALCRMSAKDKKLCCIDKINNNL